MARVMIFRLILFLLGAYVLWWAFYGLKTGEARIRLQIKILRKTSPFYYWLVLVGQCVIGAFFFSLCFGIKSF